MDTYPGIAADPGIDTWHLGRAADTGQRLAWMTNLGRLVEVIERLAAEVSALKAELERITLPAASGRIPEPNTTETWVSPTNRTGTWDERRGRMIHDHNEVDDGTGGGSG